MHSAPNDINAGHNMALFGYQFYVKKNKNYSFRWQPSQMMIITTRLTHILTAIVGNLPRTFGNVKTLLRSNEETQGKIWFAYPLH